MPCAGVKKGKGSFGLKGLAALGLILTADRLFASWILGSVLGAFALAWLLLTVTFSPRLGRNRRGLIAFAAAGVLAVILIDRTTLTGWCLFWTAISVGALSPRVGRSEDALAWAQRLIRHAGVSWLKPVSDGVRVWRLWPRTDRLSWRAAAAVAVLPLGGGVLFVGLFAAANPIIARALAAIRLPDISWTVVPRACFWLVSLVLVWATFRPGRAQHRHRSRPRGEPATGHQLAADLPGASVRSVTSALVVFNGVFAVENGLDAAFLWTGASLPDGMTLAQYAHRGAYPLIFTALLAGAFSLFVLREGSATARNRMIRSLVGLWVMQNVMLSASSILRTIDYVEAFSLTRLRIAALLWMGLVTLGLVLIGWRMWRGKSRAWLINANALALGLVLSGVSVVDLGAVAASWNVRHARTVGGTGPALDACYLQALGPSALHALLDLEDRSLSSDGRARVVYVRQTVMRELEQRQGDWREWTLRNARRLETARIRVGRLSSSPAADRCDGNVAQAPRPSNPPASSAGSTPRPLTTQAQP